MREHQIPPRLFDLCLELIARLRGTLISRTEWKNAVKKLPPEVLEKIFTFLARNYGVDDGLVQSYHEYEGLETVKLGSCCEVSESALISLSKCRSLKFLELARCPQITDRILGVILSGCSGLVKLDIASNEHLTNETLKEIGLHGTNLENLNILKCTSFDERGISHLCSCSKLKKLNVGWCKLNDDTLYRLAQKCVKLEALDMWLLRGVTTAGLQRVAGLLTAIKKLNLWAVKAVATDTVRALAHSCQQMESINFQACTSLSDDAFQVAARSDFFGGGLKKLTLTSCMLLTGASIAAIARNCPSLEKINLGQTDVSDDDVRVLVEHCPSLVRIDLEGTGISGQGLKHLTLSPCRKTMRTINLWGCTAIDDEALLLLASSCTASLRKLHLVECQVSDEGVRNICAACTDVRVLSLGAEDGICTSLGSSISQLQRLKFLRKLDLRNMDLVSDADLVPVFTHCRLMKQLHVSASDGGDKLTDASIILISRLVLLVELDVIGLAHVTDRAIVSIARSCTRLEVLELGSLPLVSAVSLEGIAEYCRSLTRVALHNLAITHDNVNMLSRKCTRLEQIDLYDQELGVNPQKLAVRSRILTIVLPSSEGGGMLTCSGFKEGDVE